MRKTCKHTTLPLLTALLLLFALPVLAFQQQDRTIKGKVTDDSKAPLPGVSITVRGTNRSVSTDESGNFEITIPAGKAFLQFSAVSYVTKEVSVGNQTIINTTLTLQSKQLSDVVVVGY